MPRLSAVAAVVIAAIGTASLGVVPSAHAECSATPRAGCALPFVPHKSSFSFAQTVGNDPDDIYKWRWFHGTATSMAAFGNPPATEYDLCIYDSSPRTQPVVATAPDNPAGWSPIRNGLQYLQRGENVFRLARLHAGPDGKANIQVHGNSDTVTQYLPFVAPVTVQLQTDGGACWETDFTAPSRSNAVKFTARD